MGLKFELVVVREEPDQITLSEMASLAGTDQETILYYIDIGLVDPVSKVGSQVLFDVNALRRLKAIRRLRRDLGTSLSSLGLILDLVDKIRALQSELDTLRGKM